MDIDSLDSFSGKKIESISFTYKSKKEIDMAVFGDDHTQFGKAIDMEIKRRIIKDIIAKYAPAEKKAVLEGLCVSEKRNGSETAVEVRYVLKTE